MRKHFFVGCLMLFLMVPCLAASPAVRIKDIARILEARDNQIMGFGLVVGLRNTGDRSQTGFTQQALTNLLSRMGVVPQSVDFKSRNVAAVMVTATLPPFVKSGQRIDVNVSSVGDATSLQGGELLITPLQGVDDQVYAVAQGSILVGLEPSSPRVPYIRERMVNSGRIPNGAMVEKEVPVTLEGKESLSIVINDPDFTTANRIVGALRREGYDASAKDAGTVQLSLPGNEDVVTMMARVERLTITPDTIAKVIINEKTGTIVVGENVTLAPVAVSYAGIDVIISDISLYSEGSSTDIAMDETRYHARSGAKVKRTEEKMTLVPAAPTLSNLVRSLNAIGASPKDLMSILQAMKKAGALNAELESI